MKDLAKRVNVGIRRADAEDAESLSQLTSELLLSWLDMFAVPEIFSYLAEDDEPFGVVSVAPASDYWLDNHNNISKNCTVVANCLVWTVIYIGLI